MRDQREIIRAAADRSGLSYRAISKAIKKNPGYLGEYLRGEVQRVGAEELMKLTKILGLDPTQLLTTDETVDSGVPRSDATLYEPAPGDAIAAQPNVVFLKMTARSVDEHAERIEPDQIAAFDTRPRSIGNVKLGDIVYAERKVAGRIEILVRQHLPPDKLLTNSSESNEILRVDDENITIVGVFLYVFRRVGGGG